jgi:hypothetical protein
MPTFRWKGTTPGGATVQGEVSADTHEAALARLRQQRVVVAEICEAGGAALTSFGAPSPGAPQRDDARVEAPAQSLTERLAEERARGGKPRPFRGAAIAAAFFLGALALGCIGPVVVCRCSRTAGGPVVCTISERDLGIVPIRTQSLSGVNAVDVESHTANERVGNDRNRIAWRENLRLVLSNGDGATIRPSTFEQRSERVSVGSSTSGGEQWIGASTKMMRDTIATFLADPASTHVSTWQGQWVPLIIAGVPALIGLLVLLLSVLALFTGPTEWIYAMAGRAAAAAAARRRRDN